MKPIYLLLCFAVFTTTDSSSQEVIDYERYFTETDRPFADGPRNAFKVKSWQNTDGDNCMQFGGHWKIGQCSVNSTPVRPSDISFDFYLRLFLPFELTSQGKEVSHIIGFKQDKCQALNINTYYPSTSLPSADSEYTTKSDFLIAKRFQGAEALCANPSQCKKIFEVETDRNSFILRRTNKYKGYIAPAFPGLPIPGWVKGSKSFYDIKITKVDSDHLEIESQLGGKKRKPKFIIEEIKCLLTKSSPPQGPIFE